MKFRRIKYKRATLKSQIEFSEWKFDLGAGLDRLLNVVARLCEKYFSLLYLNMLGNVFRYR